MKKVFTFLVAVVIAIASIGFIGASKVKADAIPGEPDVYGFVEGLYEACFDRQPTQLECEYWVVRLEDGMSAAELIGSFYFSEEYQNLEKTPGEFITDLYEGVLQRDKDTYGFRYWEEFYNMNFICIMSTDCGVMNGFIFSEEFATICEELGLPLGELYVTNERVTTFFGEDTFRYREGYSYPF